MLCIQPWNLCCFGLPKQSLLITSQCGFLVSPSESPVEIKRLQKALSAFSAFEKTHLPMHFAQVLLIVAEQPGGCTFKVIEDRLGLKNSAVSRTVMALGATDRKGQPGYGLVTSQRDPDEGRRFLVRLTNAGNKLIRELQAI